MSQQSIIHEKLSRICVGNAGIQRNPPSWVSSIRLVKQWFLGQPFDRRSRLSLKLSTRVFRHPGAREHRTLVAVQQPTFFYWLFHFGMPGNYRHTKCQMSGLGIPGGIPRYQPRVSRILREFARRQLATRMLTLLSIDR